MILDVWRRLRPIYDFHERLVKFTIGCLITKFETTGSVVAKQRLHIIKTQDELKILLWSSTVCLRTQDSQFHPYKV